MKHGFWNRTAALALAAAMVLSSSATALFGKKSAEPQEGAPVAQNVELALYGDRIVIDEGAENEWVLRFEEIMTLSVLGKNKLNIYYGDKLYQLKSDKRFNALKYVNIYFRNRNITSGEENETFLGL